MTWWQLSTSARRNNLHATVEIVSMTHGLLLSTPQSRSSGNSSTLKKSIAVQSLQKVTRSVWSWTRKRWGEVSSAWAAKCKVHPSQSQSLNRGSHNLSSHYPQTLVIKLCPFVPGCPCIHDDNRGNVDEWSEEIVKRTTTELLAVWEIEQEGGFANWFSNSCVGLALWWKGQRQRMKGHRYWAQTKKGKYKKPWTPEKRDIGFGLEGWSKGEGGAAYRSRGKIKAHQRRPK